MYPSVPCTRIRCPSRISRVACSTPTTAGKRYSRAITTPWVIRPPTSATRPLIAMMANGDFGWVHTSLLVGTGLLVVASSIGMRDAMREGPASAWGPCMVALYGVGLVGAGIFAAHPAYGSPPGTPADEHSVSLHGLLHLATGAVGFVGLITACFVIAPASADAGSTAGHAFRTLQASRSPPHSSALPRARSRAG